MTPDERALVRTVLEDMKYLRDEWDDAIDEDALRRNSTVLRRLLIHADYSKAWRAVGLAKEPRMQAVDMSAFLKGIAPEHIIVMQIGGGDHLGGVQMGPSGGFTYEMTPQEVQARFEVGKTKLDDMQPCGMREYMNRVCMAIRVSASGAAIESVTRHQLVNYVANKRGGAHLDARRDSQDPTERVYMALDRVFDGSARTADLPAVYFELLSIGQAVVRLDDAKAFMDRASEALGQP